MGVSKEDAARGRGKVAGARRRAPVTHLAAEAPRLLLERRDVPLIGLRHLDDVLLVPAGQPLRLPAVVGRGSWRQQPSAQAGLEARSTWADLSIALTRCLCVHGCV